jgi:hypothetical protein
MGFFFSMLASQAIVTGTVRISCFALGCLGMIVFGSPQGGDIGMHSEMSQSLLPTHFRVICSSL